MCVDGVEECAESLGFDEHDVVVEFDKQGVLIFGVGVVFEDFVPASASAFVGGEVVDDGDVVAGDVADVVVVGFVVGEVPDVVFGVRVVF